MASDSFDLDRFVAAQRGSYDNALAELTAGAKRSHWMWYIFPQIAGLGTSELARRFAITSLAEARAYLAHDLLGPRYLACVDALWAHRTTPAATIMGTVDAMKLRSSLTLYDRADAPPRVAATLAAFFDDADAETLRRIVSDQP
jgi:uncharacterized protein (DUF1810 family)